MEKKEEQGVFSKSRDFIHAVLDSHIEKAKGLIQGQAEKMSIDYNPWYGSDDSYYRRKPSRVSYKMLDVMSKKDSIISSIIQNRINQLASFSERQKTKFDLGYILEPKDPDMEIGPEEREELEALYYFIDHCGDNDNIPEDDKMGFDEFLRREARDRLVYDQTAIEKIRTREGKLSYFAPVDGATIRFCTKRKDVKEQESKSLESYDKKERKNEDYLYLQVIDNVIHNVYTKDDLILKMSNVTNDVKANGYSTSELELLMGVVTSHLNAETYNRKQFTQGSIQKGILHFKANISQRKLNMFKKGWYAQTSGVANSWRTPVLAGMDDVKWIPLHQSNRDIEFHVWMEYNIKIMCAIYLMDPSEINFDISQGSSGSGGNPMFTSKNEHKLKQSKDRGLRPLLRFFEDIMNDIVEEVTDKYVFKFVGLEQDSRKEENERHKLEIETYKSINEVRQENNLEPILLKFKVGDKLISPYDLPMNQNAAQMVNQLLAGESAAGMPPEGGVPGEDPSNPEEGSEIEDSNYERKMAEYDSEEDFGKGKLIKIEYFNLGEDK